MSTVPVKAIAYMTFPYTSSGVSFPNWVTVLQKNGETITDIPIDFRELPLTVYTFSFVNDGEADANWTLTVHKSGDTNNYYVESWRVTSKIVEQTVKYLRTKQDSEGGFFQTPTDK